MAGTDKGKERTGLASLYHAWLMLQLEDRGGQAFIYPATLMNPGFKVWFPSLTVCGRCNSQHIHAMRSIICGGTRQDAQGFVDR